MKTLTSGEYRLWVGVWIGLFILVTTAFPSMTSAVISASGAKEIAGASGAVAVVFGLYGKFAINIVISIALCWITARRLNDAHMSRAWLLMFFPALYTGMAIFVLLGTSEFVAFATGMIGREIPVPWHLIAAIGFLLFLCFYEGTSKGFLGVSRDLPDTAKITAIVTSVFIGAMTLPSVLIAMKIIPVIGPLLWTVGGQLTKVILWPMLKLQSLFGVNVMMIMTLALLCSLSIIVYYDYIEDDADDDVISYQPNSSQMAALQKKTKIFQNRD